METQSFIHPILVPYFRRGDRVHCQACGSFRRFVVQPRRGASTRFTWCINNQVLVAAHHLRAVTWSEVGRLVIPEDYPAPYGAEVGGSHLASPNPLVVRYVVGFGAEDLIPTKASVHLSLVKPTGDILLRVMTHEEDLRSWRIHGFGASAVPILESLQDVPCDSRWEEGVRAAVQTRCPPKYLLQSHPPK